MSKTDDYRFCVYEKTMPVTIYIIRKMAVQKQKKTNLNYVSTFFVEMFPMQRRVLSFVLARLLIQSKERKLGGGWRDGRI